MTIYKITCKLNNKIYVGQTHKPVNLRFNNHKYELRKGNHFNDHLQRSWNKYGQDAFEFSVLEDNVEDIDAREIYWIRFFDSTNPNKGFNRHAGGSKNRLVTEETRAKISRSLMGNTRCIGRVPSQETKEKQRKARLGKKLKPRSEDTKRKISEALRGSKSIHWGKPGVNRKQVLCVTTGQVFESATEAAKVLGCDRSSICAVCRGSQEQTKNLKFTYAVNI